MFKKPLVPILVMVDLGLVADGTTTSFLYRSPTAFDEQGDKFNITMPVMTPEPQCKCVTFEVTSDSQFTMQIDLTKVSKTDAGSYDLKVVLADVKAS